MAKLTCKFVECRLPPHLEKVVPRVASLDWIPQPCGKKDWKLKMFGHLPTRHACIHGTTENCQKKNVLQREGVIEKAEAQACMLTNTSDGKSQDNNTNHNNKDNENKKDNKRKRKKKCKTTHARAQVSPLFGTFMHRHNKRFVK